MRPLRAPFLIIGAIAVAVWFHALLDNFDAAGSAMLFLIISPFYMQVFREDFVHSTEHVDWKRERLSVEPMHWPSSYPFVFLCFHRDSAAAACDIAARPGLVEARRLKAMPLFWITLGGALLLASE